MEISKKLIKESIAYGFKEILDQGFPKETLQEILKYVRPMGHVVYISKHMGITEEAVYNEFFTESRKSGVDGSVPNAYGGSTVPSILGISPYVSPTDVYMDMKGIEPKEEEKEEDIEKKELIFGAGHTMEPVYRDYFRIMYGDRYTVVNTDLQFSSKKWKHFVLNIDGLLYDKKTGEYGVLEIKHTSYRNTKTINAFKMQDVPAHYDAQGRCYMEGLNASFVCFFLGYGNRPVEDDTAFVRVERDSDLATTMLNNCEGFIHNYVEANRMPSLFSVKDKSLLRKNVADLYGEVNPKKKAVQFSDALKPHLAELLKAKEVYDEAKKEEKEAKKKADEAEEKFEQFQSAFIAELKDAPSGYIDGDNGSRYWVYYDTRKALNIDKVLEKYPEAFEECRKPALDTPRFKKFYPKEYSDCFERKEGGKRSFRIVER